MIIKIFLLIVGLVLLALGADWLVKRASRLALSRGISALVVGLTVVLRCAKILDQKQTNNQN
jgi:Ca2+/Na+ antiporter